MVNETIRFGGLYWLVLAVQNGRALLLSERVIAERAFHSSGKVAGWAECDLRAYLNEGVYHAFTEEDRARIAEASVHTDGNPWIGTPAGEDTCDRVFLLSLDEMVLYFGDSGQLSNRNPNSKYWLNDAYNAGRVARDRTGKACWWWLRSPGINRSAAIYVNTGGSINLAGHRVYNPYGGVRPALWLNLQS